MKKRESLVRFRSLIHMFINQKQYVKVGDHLGFGSSLLWTAEQKCSVCDFSVGR